jgi:putative nucleotidyltransferase with HDIG domain
MGERDLRFRVYAWAVATLAAIGIAASWSVDGYVRQWPLLATLVFAVLVSELLAVDLENGASISLTYPLGVCTIVLFGPTGAAGLAALSLVPSLFTRGRSSVTKAIFNMGQLALSALVPALAYLALGGHPLALGVAGGAGLKIAPLPGLAAASFGILVNFGLGAVGYSMVHDVSLRQVWRHLVSWMIASQAALGLLGLAIAQVMASEGWLGFALFVVPLVVARQTHSRYLSLREAYADTVRSLVAAIEAKDPYTKGHSIRVARFAVAIAEAMSLEEGQAQNIEYAALLHDLGKIGISRAVLAKTGALTDEEYGSIKEHPAIGARILESVPFLDSVRPAVQDHHERVDGKGYGRRISGAELSVEARILAVADSYDAMTADRPYRDALSADAAIAELRVNSGTQFDQEIVEAFLSILPGLEREEPEQIEAVQGGVSLAEA